MTEKTLWQFCADFQFTNVSQHGVVFILNTAALEDFGELVEGPRPSDEFKEKVASWIGEALTEFINSPIVGGRLKGGEDPADG